MARPDKAAAVAAMKESFSESAAVVLTEYRGLTVQDLKTLRRSLGEDATYAVAKNTLATIAAREAGIEGLEGQLVGPTALAFITGDVATVAKGLRDFAKANPLLVIKGGVMDGRVLDAEAVKKLADLESREVLLAKLAGAMKGSLQQAVFLFAAPLGQAARAMGALEQKAQGDPSVIGGAGSVDAVTTKDPSAEGAETTGADAPADETAAAAAADPEDAPAASADSEDATAASSTETAADAAADTE